MYNASSYSLLQTLAHSRCSKDTDQAWCKPIIPAPWGLRQEDLKFHVSLGCLKTNNTADPCYPWAFGSHERSIEENPERSGRTELSTALQRLDSFFPVTLPDFRERHAAFQQISNFQLII
jgi:hypothetical protein